MPPLPPEFQAWRTRFHELLLRAVEATPMRFEAKMDPRTLFLTYRPGCFDIRAVLSTSQEQGVIYVRRRTELVIPTDRPLAVKARVEAILAAAGNGDYPVPNPGKGQYVQHTGEFPIPWEAMQQNEHESLAWYLFHIVRLHDLFQAERAPW